jgi:hypothetical protein
VKNIITLVLTVCLLSINGYAYGPRGHQLVGAIADRRLATNEAVANKLNDLLDGLTLERAATLPDEIKSRRCGDDPTGSRLDRELQAFVNANCANPSHNEFHFTNIPVSGDEQYADGEVGRGKFDIVKMIPFSIRVLKGEEPQTNPRGITKTIAVILIAHYLGDIHQPLHVAAEFFDAEGNPFTPDTSTRGFASQGGNKLILFTFVGGKKISAGKLHSYWDSQTVKNAFGNQRNSTVARRLANREPENWELSGEIETWSEQLANGILPLGREAHQRLEYSDILVRTGQRDITSGRCDERKRTRGGQFYAVWASNVVRDQIHRGGWRLAAILEKALQ